MSYCRPFQLKLPTGCHIFIHSFIECVGEASDILDTESGHVENDCIRAVIIFNVFMVLMRSSLWEISLRVIISFVQFHAEMPDSASTRLTSLLHVDSLVAALERVFGPFAPDNVSVDQSVTEIQFSSRFIVVKLDFRTDSIADHITKSRVPCHDDALTDELVKSLSIEFSTHLTNLRFACLALLQFLIELLLQIDDIEPCGLVAGVEETLGRQKVPPRPILGAAVCLSLFRSDGKKCREQIREIFIGFFVMAGNRLNPFPANVLSPGKWMETTSWVFRLLCIATFTP